MSRLGRKESGRRLHGAPKESGHIEGIITHLDEHTCRLKIGSDSYPLVTLTIAMPDIEFEVGRRRGCACVSMRSQGGSPAPKPSSKGLCSRLVWTNFWQNP